MHRKFGRVVFEMCVRTDRRTDILVTIPSGGGGENYAAIGCAINKVHQSTQHRCACHSTARQVHRINGSMYGRKAKQSVATGMPTLY